MSPEMLNNLSLESDDFLLACPAEINQEIQQEWQQIYQQELETRQTTQNFNHTNLEYQNNSSSLLAEKVVMTVTLDADLAQVFNTSESVNNALRHLLSAIP
jgi:hypothetical protein